MARRNDRLVVRDLGDEVLVYDLDSNEAHRLAGSAAHAWRVASGKAGPSQKVSHADVRAASEELARLGLVEAPAGFSRRSLLRGAAVGGGALVALPVIETITAPMALAACSTPTGGTSLAQAFTDEPTSGTNNGINPIDGFTFFYRADALSPTTATGNVNYAANEYGNNPKQFSRSSSGGTIGYDNNTDKNVIIVTKSNNGVGFFYTVSGPSPTDTETVNVSYTITNTDNKTITYYVGTSPTAQTLASGATVSASPSACLQVGTKFYLFIVDGKARVTFTVAQTTSGP
jgi:hypothetical protein